MSLNRKEMNARSLRREDAEPIPIPTIDKNCQHIHWIVYGHNKVGFGQCLDCNKELGLNELINNTIERLRKAAKETMSKEI